MQPTRAVSKPPSGGIRKLSLTAVFALLLALVSAFAAPPVAAATSEKIIFSEGTSRYIISINPDGTDPTIIGRGTDPRVSPDGERIAYTGLDRDIHIRSVDGSDVDVTNTPSVDEAKPEWAPDGQSLLFWEPATDTIKSINVDGTNSHILLQDSEMASYSPDGSKLVTESWTAQHLGLMIGIANADGTNLHAIGSTDDGWGNYSPTWSPDGSMIAWNSYCDPPSGALYCVSVMNPDGSDRKDLLVMDGSSELIGQVAWSPDSSKLVGSGSSNSLYVITMSGEVSLLYTNPSDESLTPSWAQLDQNFPVYDTDPPVFGDYGPLFKNVGATLQLEVPVTDSGSGVALAYYWVVDADGNESDTLYLTYDGSNLVSDPGDTILKDLPPGDYQIYVDASDTNDNWSETIVDLTVEASTDTTPPTVTIGGVTDGVTYAWNQVPSPVCNTTDSGSGVATNATLSVTHSGTSYTATCSGAVDNAGNTAADVSVNYTVQAQPVGTVVVMDSYGNPLSSVPVKIRTASGVTTNYTTDANGVVNATLANGTYTASVTYATGTVSKSLTITTGNQGSVTFQTVAVTAAVADSHGSPLTNGSVAQAGNSGAFNAKVPVNGNGQVTYEVLPGTNSFTAWFAGGYQTKTVTVPSSGPYTVNFNTVAVTVNISDPVTADITAATVTQAGKSGTFGPKTAVDGNGNVSFEVLSGTNSFTAWVAGGSQTKTVTVPDTGPYTVNFVTYPVTVQVYDAQGNPATSAQVTHAGSSGVFSPKTDVDGNGQVTFYCLPGTSTFTAWMGSSYRTGSLSVSGASDFALTFYVA